MEVRINYISLVYLFITDDLMRPQGSGSNLDRDSLQRAHSISADVKSILRGFPEKSLCRDSRFCGIRLSVARPIAWPGTVRRAHVILSWVT